MDFVNHRFGVSRVLTGGPMIEQPLATPEERSWQDRAQAGDQAAFFALADRLEQRLQIVEGAWIARAKAGDRDAFAALYARHERRLYAFVYRLSGSADDAALLMRETFSKAYHALGQTDDVGDVGSWLHWIAAIACLDLLRQRRQLTGQPEATTESAKDRHPRLQVREPRESGYRLAPPSTELAHEVAGTTPPVPRSLLEAVQRVYQRGSHPLRAAFLARTLNALARVSAELGDDALGHAVGAPSDYATLLHALEEPEALEALQQEDRLAAARLRGLHARAQLFEAEGGTLPVDEVAKILGITRQAVDKRRRAGRLLALQTGRRGYAYPLWQFTADGVLAGFEETLAALRHHDPWTQAAFFLSGNLYLDGESPLSALRRGHVSAVRRAAQAHGEEGAA